MIILIGGEKGGTGKTTLATNIAAMMVNDGKEVLLVDTDKQNTSSLWCGLRSEKENIKRVPCVQMFGNGINNDINDFKKKFEYIIVDAGGRDNIELRSAMTVANKLYIPFQASQFDIWTIPQMTNLINLILPMNPNLEVYAIINCVSTNPVVTEFKDTCSLFEETENIKVLPFPLCDRICYRKAALKGLSVCELEPLDYKARQEINQLYEEILK